MTAGGGIPRPRRELALAALFFLAYTVLATWPQAIHMSDAMTDLWDAKLSAWILHWDYVQTLRAPLDLFQAPIVHPAKYALAFSENLYGAAVFGFPLLAAGASPVLNYNVLLLLGMFLSAWAAWALARYVTGDPAASLIAGLVYGFLPYKLAQLAHFHMQWGAFLPLVFLYLLRYLDGGRRRDAVLLGVAFAWNALACIQYAFFTGLLLVAVLGYELVQARPCSRARVGGALLAMAIAAIPVVPFAIPYQKAADLYGMKRYVGEMTFFSATPGYFLSAGERNKLWGPITEKYRGPEGDFFPGALPLVFAGIAVLRLRRRGPPPAPAGPPSSTSRTPVRAMDAVVVLLAAVWIAALSTPGLRLGPVSVGDASRVQVLLTLAVFFRLTLAFPRWSRYRSLGDFLRRQSLDPRVVLLLVILVVGVVVALGGHTPYYRFLFQTFGSVFRAIRVAARGVVLFQVALAVLAAWGLSLLTRGRRPWVRGVSVAAAVAVITLEYRAFPVVMMPYDSRPVPVYEWLRGQDVAGAAVEWPFGFPYDCEYTLRQAEHGQPIVNGHTSFLPATYGDIAVPLKQRPIPDEVWDVMRRLGGRVLVYHSHQGRGIKILEYAYALRRGLASGEARLLEVFPHGDGEDFAFRVSRAPHGQPAPPFEARRFEETVSRLERKIALLDPPLGDVRFPKPVAPGDWQGGWALDDSGIVEVRIASERGSEGVALLHMRMPGLEKNFPEYPEAQGDRGGFGFPVPNLPPGPHTLTFTLLARDGGVTVLTRPVVVRAK